MRLLRAATLVTPDPVATARLYQTWFGYQLAETGIVSADLAALWGAPAVAGRRVSVIRPASGSEVYLRFIEGGIPADYRPLRSFGWGAIEICIQDVLALHETLQASPFTIIGPPKALDGAPAIWPMQVQGPDGEIIFLTEIRDDEPHARLPRAACPVDCLFIAVLACHNLAATRAWFETTLGLQGGADFSLAYTMLSRAFDLPLSTKHKIAVLGHVNDAFLQLDEYPEAAIHRHTPPGELPPGIAMISLAMPPGAGLPAAQCAKPAGIIYQNAAMRCLRTPEGALVELIGP